MICLIAVFFFSCSFQSVPSTIFDLKESDLILYKPSSTWTSLLIPLLGLSRKNNHCPTGIHWIDQNEILKAVVVVFNAWLILYLIYNPLISDILWDTTVENAIKCRSWLPAAIFHQCHYVGDTSQGGLLCTAPLSITIQTKLFFLFWNTIKGTFYFKNKFLIFFIFIFDRFHF